MGSMAKPQAFRDTEWRPWRGSVPGGSEGCGTADVAGVGGFMRFFHSRAAMPVLIVLLLATITAAGLATSWTLSIVMWLSSAVLAAALFATLMQDAD
jgi:hypothetical protein